MAKSSYLLIVSLISASIVTISAQMGTATPEQKAKFEKWCKEPTSEDFKKHFTCLIDSSKDDEGKKLTGFFTECLKKQELEVPADAEGFKTVSCDPAKKDKMKATWMCFMTAANGDESIDMMARREKMQKACPHPTMGH